MQVICEIGIDAILKILCLANIDDSILTVSPSINSGAGRYVFWLIRNLHENYLVADFPAEDFSTAAFFVAGFLAGTLTSVAFFAGFGTSIDGTDLAGVFPSSGFKNRAV